MDDVVEDARRLAERLAAHPRTKELREASAEVAGDPVAKSLEEEYARLSSEVHHLEETRRPIEPETKRRLLDLQGKIRKSAALQRLFRAHASFAEMMDGVQRLLGSALDEALGGGAHGGPAAADGEDPAGDAHAHGPGCGHDHGPGPEPRGAKPPEEPPPSGRILWTP
jgi:cell fate (sporulation/competence/biofilm development) regulator YlbF (YheA/YmcA/DUF963 family)